MDIIRNFSLVDDEAKVIKENLVKVAKYAMYHDSRLGKMADKKFSLVDNEIENYDELNEKAKIALLSFCADKAQIKRLETNGDVIKAFSNSTFATIYNSIIVDVLESIVLRSRPEQIFRLANVDEVDAGDSKTYDIETKGLPIAQRTSYTTNVTFLDSYSRMSLTITPKPYSMGTTMDYIRILANNYDMGKEIARVAFGLLYAQLRLIVDEIYSVTPITGTPFYQNAWNADNYVQMIEDLKMLNGGADVTAYGTISAFHETVALLFSRFCQDRFKSGIIVHNRYVRVPAEIGNRSESRRNPFRSPAHQIWNLLTVFFLESTDGPFHVDFLGNDIPRATAMDLGNADDSVMERARVAADDGLHTGNDLACDDDRIDGGIGNAGMPSDTVDFQFKTIGTGHQSAFTDADRSDRQIRLVVHPEDGGNAGKNTGCFDPLRTLRDFFGWLENETDSTSQ